MVKYGQIFLPLELQQSLLTHLQLFTSIDILNLDSSRNTSKIYNGFMYY